MSSSDCDKHSGLLWDPACVAALLRLWSQAAWVHLWALRQLLPVQPQAVLLNSLSFSFLDSKIVATI